MNNKQVDIKTNGKYDFATHKSLNRVTHIITMLYALFSSGSHITIKSCNVVIEYLHKLKNVHVLKVF